MCGIVGVISKEPGGLFQFDAEVFEDLLIANSVRGKDSTGVFGITRRNEAHILKQGSDPFVLFRHPTYKTFKDKIKSDFHIVIGHNRKATSGSVTSVNAHPFKEEHIILVHNGNLVNHKSLADVEVDSHALCHSLAKKGVTKTLENIEGAFALVWYDLKEKALFLWHNGERPIDLYQTDARLFIASELPMLKWLLNRDTFSYNNKGCGNMKPFELIKIKVNPFSLETTSLKPKLKSWQRSSPGNLITPFDVDRPRYSDVNADASSNDEVAEVVLSKDDNLSEPSAKYKSGSLLAVKDLYPFGSPVVYIIDGYSLFTNEPKQFRVVGTAYLPGKSPIRAYAYPKGWSGADCQTFKSHIHGVLGEVDKVIGLQTGQVILHLNKLIIPEYVRVCNRLTMPVLEWNRLCDVSKCDKCSKLMQGLNHEHGKTMVTRTDLGEYKIICSTCMTNAITNKEKQDAFFKGRDPAVQAGE